MLEELKDIKDKIKFLLEKYPTASDSDKFLYFAYSKKLKKDWLVSLKNRQICSKTAPR
jgi:hypothetical protein